MKSRRHQFLAICFIFLFSIVGFSQVTVTIKLIVDTGNFDENNLNQSCSFEVRRSNSSKVERSNGNLKDFTVEANVDDIIKWEGESKSSNISIVDIKIIDRKNNSKIFKNKKHYGKKRGRSKNKIIEAKALHSTKGKDDYKYDISFEINHTGKSYTIDPKIRVRRRL